MFLPFTSFGIASCFPTTPPDIIFCAESILMYHAAPIEIFSFIEILLTLDAEFIFDIRILSCTLLLKFENLFFQDFLFILKLR